MFYIVLMNFHCIRNFTCVSACFCSSVVLLLWFLCVSLVHHFRRLWSFPSSLLHLSLPLRPPGMILSPNFTVFRHKFKQISAVFPVRPYFLRLRSPPLLLVQIKGRTNHNPLTLPQAVAGSSSSWSSHAQFESQKVQSGIRINANSLVNRAVPLLL